MNQKLIRKVLLSGMAVFLLPAVHADVRTDFEISLQAGGDYASMTSSGKTSTWISGDKSRTESQMESESSYLGGYAQDVDTTAITILSEEVIRNLFPDKQQFNEIHFRDMRAQFDDNREQMARYDSERTLPVEEDDCIWSERKFNKEVTGERKYFADVRGDREILSYYQTCTVPDTGKICEMSWILDRYMAKRMPGENEIRDYHRDYSRRMGLDELASSLGSSAMPLFNKFGSGWEEIGENAKDDKRYPVHMILQLEMGGEACTTHRGDPIGSDDVWGSAAGAGIRSGAYSAGYYARYGAYRAAGGGVSGSIASSAAGAAASAAVTSIIKALAARRKRSQNPWRKLRHRRQKITIWP